jgi:hypothetical protein
MDEAIRTPQWGRPSLVTGWQLGGRGRGRGLGMPRPFQIGVVSLNGSDTTSSTPIPPKLGVNA